MRRRHRSRGKRSRPHARPGSEPRQITARAAARSDVLAVDGLLLVSGALVPFGPGWRQTAGRALTLTQRILVGSWSGQPRLVNERSRWAAFTTRREGWTEVHTISPDGRQLHFIVSVTDDGVKTVDPAALPVAP